MLRHPAEVFNQLRATLAWRSYEQAVRDQLFLAATAPALSDAELLSVLADWKALKSSKEAAQAILLGRAIPDLAHSKRL